MGNEFDYTSAAKIKAEMPDVPTADWGTSYDSIMATLATRVSRYIDGYMGRPAGAFAIDLNSEPDTTSYYPGGGRKVFMREEWLQFTSIAVTTSMTGDYTTLVLPGTDSNEVIYYNHSMRVVAAPASRAPVVALEFTEHESTPANLPNAVRVVGIQGYATGTDANPGEAVIEQAATALAIRWWKRGQSAWADAAGQAEQLDMSPLSFSKAMDAEIREMLGTIPRLVK